MSSISTASTLGGPVYIPRLLTGKKKLFFFDNFERTTRRQLISGTQTVPDTNMIGGNFSEAQPLYGALRSSSHSGFKPVVYSLCRLPNPRLHKRISQLPVPPQLHARVRRDGFQHQHDSSRAHRICFEDHDRQPGAHRSIDRHAQQLAIVPRPCQRLQRHTGTFAYNRMTNDAKITYIPSDSTQIFGKYSIEPFTNTDPQTLGGGRRRNI